MTKDNLEKELIKLKLGNMPIEEIYCLISQLKGKVDKDRKKVVAK